ncbi:39527_t:CDS:2, partial [Gigaspora margarita]
MYSLNGDREQFQKQFSSWEIGHSEFDKIIRGSQLFIKYPNVNIQWIPYKNFSNIEGTWRLGLCPWQGVQYQNTPVALEELIKSENISKYFLEEFKKLHAKEIKMVNKLDILRHILFGLSVIHARGLVHRDLHPGNLLHCRRTISVSDLGLCRPIYDINESKKFMVLFPDNRNYDEYLIKEICERNQSTSSENADPNKRPTTKELYQKILFWLNEFNKSPLPETVNQFVTSNSELSKNHKVDKIADTNSVDIDNNGDESDEWNTLHVNDYQNWLYNFDIMRDYSEEKIASIVNKNFPQLEFNETRAFEKPIIMENKSTNEEKNRLPMKKKNLTSMRKQNR